MLMPDETPIDFYLFVFADEEDDEAVKALHLI